MTGPRPTPAVQWPDIAGRIVSDAAGVRHILPVRVYFEDTDAGGVAYHGSYLRWCERGRSDLLRLLGIDARSMMDGTSLIGEPAVFFVRRMTLDFLRPGRIDDLLEVVTGARKFGGASITLTQEIVRGSERLCEAEVVVVLAQVSGKPLRLPEAMRKAFGAG